MEANGWGEGEVMCCKPKWEHCKEPQRADGGQQAVYGDEKSRMGMRRHIISPYRKDPKDLCSPVSITSSTQ